MIGTPDYMAPEQITGGKISPATDVFAVGVVMYEFLANRATFEGDTLHAVLYKIVSEQPPPLRDAAGSLPPSLQPILDKALAKDPAQRYQSAGAMARDLTKVRTALSGAATVAVAARATPLRTARITRPVPSRRKRPSRLVWIGAGAGVVVLGVGAALLLGTGQPRPQETAARAVPVAPAAQVAAETGRPTADSSSASQGGLPGAGASAAASTAQALPRTPPPGPPQRGEATSADPAPRGAGVGRPAVDVSAPGATPSAVAAAAGAAPAPAAGETRADTGAPVAKPAPIAAPQPAPPAAAAQPAPPSAQPAETPADARAPLEALVAAYASAIESRSVLEIRRFYPGMTGPQQRAWEQFFGRVRAVQVWLSIAQLDVNGATADLTVTGEFEADGRAPRQPMRFQATAAQMAGGWRFRSVR